MGRFAHSDRRNATWPSILIDTLPDNVRNEEALKPYDLIINPLP
jgi:hypothetical protein